MAQGQIGHLTGVAEGLAAAVGAGMLLGGFGVGAFGLLVKRPRRVPQARVLDWGYYGGIVGMVLAVTDLVTRYGV